MTATTASGPARAGRFASLHVRNFRVYWLGQTVSHAGTWMQSIGQGWLVLQLSDSGTALGVVFAMQTLPVLFLAPLGGLLVDRFSKRTLLVLTQTVSAVLALVLWALVATDRVELWMVFALALGLGFVTVIDNPVRQTLSIELVGPELVTNAVSLNNVNFNMSRVAGPALAGVVINRLGIAPCFLVNGLSYVAGVVSVLLVRPAEMHTQAPTTRARRQIREGLAYVWRTPQLRVPIVMMFVIGLVTYEIPVTLPLLAEETFAGDAGTYSLFTSAMGVGAVVMGLGYATRLQVTPRIFLRLTVVLGVVMLACGAAPNLPLAVAAMVALGGASVSFLAAANSTLQLTTPGAMRGRVLALWTMAFLGTAPIGGPLVGWIAETFGARWGMYVGGIAPLVVAAWAWPRMRAYPNGLAALSPPPAP